MTAVVTALLSLAHRVGSGLAAVTRFAQAGRDGAGGFGGDEADGMRIDGCLHLGAAWP